MSVQSDDLVVSLRYAIARSVADLTGPAVQASTILIVCSCIYSRQIRGCNICFYIKIDWGVKSFINYFTINQFVKCFVKNILERYPYLMYFCATQNKGDTFFGV